MRARRVDSNHAEIVAAFRDMGCTVLDLSRVGCGCPDILVARNGQNVLVEIKDGRKKPSACRLTPDEQRFHETWKGRVCIVADVETAVMIGRTMV